jgi:peptidoglycan hydrolase-like protein with peptidoglycan-binding domain
MAVAKSKHTAQDAIHLFKTFLGKKRPELPWLNGKTKGFPDRVHGFYDCALGYSYISGLRPVMVSCHVVVDYCKANKVWFGLNAKKVQPGDAVIFDWSGKQKETDHIGMVISVDLKKKTVTYVSADTGPVIPGIVTLNTVGFKFVTGFGRPVDFAEPMSHVPVVSVEKRELHSATVAAPVEAPVQVALPTDSSVVAAVAPVQSKPAATRPAAAVVQPALLKNPGYPGHYLKSGSKEDAVKYVQQQLKIKVTGVFDTATDKAVKATQAKHKLTADGVVGPLTWKVLG